MQDRGWPGKPGSMSMVQNLHRNLRWPLVLIRLALTYLFTFLRASDANSRSSFLNLVGVIWVAPELPEDKLESIFRTNGARRSSPQRCYFLFELVQIKRRRRIAHKISPPLVQQLLRCRAHFQRFQIVRHILPKLVHKLELFLCGQRPDLRQIG